MITFYLICVLSALSALFQAPDCGCEDKPQLNVLAVVNGVTITKTDLSIDTRTQISLLQDTVIAARSLSVNPQINKLLLEAEAKRRGLTPAKLLELEVNAKLVQPTDDEVRAYYNQFKQVQEFKHVKKDMIAQMMKERENLRSRVFANSLRVAAQVTTSNEPVTPPRTEADLSRVFANVNGVNITSRDIEESLLPLIFQVQQQVYALRKKDLDLKINDMLLDQEAKRLGTTTQALIDQHVRLRLPIITDEQARAFYDKNKSTLQGDFSKIKFQIVLLLLHEEQRKLSLAYAEELRKAAAVQIYLTEPVSPNLRQLCCNPVD
jgi:hypothetical protein